MKFIELELRNGHKMHFNLGAVESIEGELDEPATIWCIGSEHIRQVKQTVREILELIPPELIAEAK